MGDIYTKSQPLPPPEPSFAHTLPEEVLLLQWFLIPATKAIQQAPARKFHSVQISKTPIFQQDPGSLCSSGMYFTGFTWEKDLKPQGFDSTDYNSSGNKKQLDIEASHFALRKKTRKSPFLTAVALVFLGHDTQESSCCLFLQSPLKN